jgi:hypothetical protein
MQKQDHKQDHKIKQDQKEEYLVFHQHEYSSPKYWVVAGYNSLDELDDEEINDLAHVKAHGDDNADLILVKVIKKFEFDPELISKIWYSELPDDEKARIDEETRDIEEV